VSPSRIALHLATSCNLFDVEKNWGFDGPLIQSLKNQRFEEISSLEHKLLNQQRMA